MIPATKRDLKKLYAMLARLYAPPEQMTAHAWADKYRRLPKSAAEGGRYRSDRTPWVREILEAIDSPKYNTVIVWTASQVGKTEGVIANHIGKTLHLNPVPMGFFLPDKDAAKDISQDRIKPMMMETPELWRCVTKGQAFQTFKLTVNGVKLYLLSARSASQMASRPMGIVYVDEYSRISAHGKEGDVRDIIDARGNTYPGFTAVITSTATEGEAVREVNPRTRLSYWEFPGDVPDPTVTLWRNGTRKEWAIPCKHCGQFFVADLSTLLIPDLGTPEESAAHARIKCPACEGLMNEADKFQANARGVFINGQYQSIDNDGAIHGEIPANSIASFWVPGLVSMFPGGTIQKRALKLLEARRAGQSEREAKEKAVLNVQFGELWAPQGTGTESTEVEKLVISLPPGKIPPEVTALTMGVDGGGDRLWYVIRAWAHGSDMTSWLVEAGEIHGSLSPLAKMESGMLPIFQRLNEKLLQAYDGLYISACAIDAGYETELIYDFCQHHDQTGVAFPIMGDDYVRNYLMKPSTIGYRGNGKPARDMLLWHLNTDALKRQVHKSYRLPAHTYGSFNIPEHAFEDAQKRQNYLKHLTSESRVLDKKTGKHYWRRHTANHWFDCEVYARAAALKLDIQHWEPAPRESPKPNSKTPPSNAGGWINHQGGWL